MQSPSNLVWSCSGEASHLGSNPISQGEPEERHRKPKQRNMVAIASACHDKRRALRGSASPKKIKWDGGGGFCLADALKRLPTYNSPQARNQIHDQFCTSANPAKTKFHWKPHPKQPNKVWLNFRAFFFSCTKELCESGFQVDSAVSNTRAHSKHGRLDCKGISDMGNKAAWLSSFLGTEARCSKMGWQATHKNRS